MSMYVTDETAAIDHDDSLATQSRASIIGSFAPFRKPFVASNLVFDNMIEESTFGGMSQLPSTILRKTSSSRSIRNASDNTAVDSDWRSSLKDLDEAQEEDQKLEQQFEEELGALKTHQQDLALETTEIQHRLNETMEGVSSRPQISQTPTELKAGLSFSRNGDSAVDKQVAAKPTNQLQLQLEEEVDLLDIASGPDEFYTDDLTMDKHNPHRKPLSEVSNISKNSQTSGRNAKQTERQNDRKNAHSHAQADRIRAPSYASFGTATDIRTKDELEHLKQLLAQSEDGKKLLQKHTSWKQSQTPSIGPRDSLHSLFERSLSMSVSEDSEFGSPSPTTSGSNKSTGLKSPRTPSSSIASETIGNIDTIESIENISDIGDLEDATAPEDHGTFVSMKPESEPNAKSKSNNMDRNHNACRYTKALYEQLRMDEIDKLSLEEARDHLKRITECFRHPFPEFVDKCPSLAKFLSQPDVYYEFGDRIHHTLYGKPFPASFYRNPNQACLNRMANQVAHCVQITSSVNDFINQHHA